MSRGDKAGCAMERRAGSREGRPGVDVDDGLTVRGWLAGEVFPGCRLVGWLLCLGLGAELCSAAARARRPQPPTVGSTYLR
jgi:hypothetical protein